MDILLSQNLHASRVLYLIVNILSSFSKLTPQFLGELCLTTGMSGIDQQFLHYIHPTVVIVIILIISLLARKFPKYIEIISRKMDCVICSLLLLSYTSIASTSLLLVMPLKVHDSDKYYTYLSPGIEYFHGHHLPYGIVAIFCLIFIALVCFILALNPFSNQTFSSKKINCKPFLDQFQECYKDEYR